MQITVDFRNAKEKDLAALGRMLRNPVELMKKIGAVMIEATDNAFEKQEFPPHKWPERYPGQNAPKLNIAGALMDFKSGRVAPKPNRFADRPALIDEGKRGGLWGSVTWRATGPVSFQVGTNKPYARLHQFGGTSSIRYDGATKDRMRAWLYTKKGKPKKGREGYVQHLQPLLRKGRYTRSQRILRRPFLGWNDRIAADVLETIKLYIQKIRNGGL